MIFEVPQSQCYEQNYIHLRNQSAPLNGYLFDVKQNNTCKEDYVNSRNGAVPVTFTFNAGDIIRVDFFNREAGVKIDNVTLEFQ